MGNTDDSEVTYEVDKDHQEAIDLYTTITGRINENYVSDLNNYDISSPDSEKILEYCEWEDFRKDEAYDNCIVKNSDYYRSVQTYYSFQELINAIKNFTSNKEFCWHIKQMEKNYTKMKSERLSTDEKKACALVLSYYTGYKDNSDRSSRNTNALIRSSNKITITKRWSDGKHFYPVIFYLTKAISSLPFYWGYPVRCVQLTKSQALSYKPGTVITWLQWSSSKIGKKPADYFKKRNTWFFIYSLTSREISQFSVYSNEKEALYSRFSHFLIFKNELKNNSIISI